VRFVVTMIPEKLRAAEAEGLHKFFKLQTTVSLSSMVNVVSVSAYFCNLLSDFFVNVLRSWNFLIVLQDLLAFIVILSCFLLQCIINVCYRKW
jgi:hypothetical protein